MDSRQGACIEYSIGAFSGESVLPNNACASSLPNRQPPTTNHQPPTAYRLPPYRAYCCFAWGREVSADVFNPLVRRTVGWVAGWLGCVAREDNSRRGEAGEAAKTGDRKTDKP